MCTRWLERVAALFGVTVGTVGVAILAATLSETGALSEGTEGIVFGVSWAPDGTRIATASQDGKVRVWDQVTAKTPVLARTLDDYKGKTVFSVRFSPDSGAILYGGDSPAGGDPPTAVVRQVTAPIPGKGWVLNAKAGVLAVSKDAAKVAVAAAKKVSVRDLDGGTTVTFADANDTLAAIAWRDGPIASGDASGGIALWPAAGAAGAAPLASIAMPDNKPIRALAFAPGQSRLFAASDGKVVRVISTLQTPAITKTVTELIAASAVSAKGATLAAASLAMPAMGTPQQVISIWDGTTSGPAVFNPPSLSDAIASIGVSDDGTLIAWGITGGHFGFVKSSTMGFKLGDATSDAAAGDVTAIAPSHDGTLVVLGYATGVVRVRKVADSSVAVLPAAASQPDRRGHGTRRPCHRGRFHQHDSDSTGQRVGKGAGAALGDRRVRDLHHDEDVERRLSPDGYNGMDVSSRGRVPVRAGQSLCRAHAASDHVLPTLAWCKGT